MKLFVYGSNTPLDVKGRFKANLSIGGKQVRDTIYVSSDFNRGVSLLSRKTSKLLGLVTINLPISQIAIASPEGTSEHPLLLEFSDICHGVGCHKDLAISLPLTEGAKPSVAPPSQIPVNLFNKVKQEIDRLTDQGVFEDVPVDDDCGYGRSVVR